MRLATPLAIVALAAALLAGCGGSSSSREGSGTGSTSPSESAKPPASSSKPPIGATARSCDSGAVDAEGLRATGVSCGQARQVMYGWQRNHACSAPPGASRTACSSRSYRCLGARTDRGIAVSCSRPSRSIAFVATKH